MKGVFITFEGAEGSGKSTQARMVHSYLKRKKIPVLFIREPGGVKISEAIRRLLLDVKNEEMTKVCETLLYMAARSQLVEEKILPALKEGKVVLSDRFLDSTIVYQGYGNGVNMDFIRRMGYIVTQGRQPDLTLLFDLPAEKGLSRTGKVKDRIERRSLHYHNRVRQGYLKLARREPGRIKVIRVNKGKKGIQEMVRPYVDAWLKRR